MSARTPSDPTSEYRSKLERELHVISETASKSGHPRPFGDPLRGVLIVLEQPVGPRVLDALDKSLTAVGLPDACVTFTETGTLYPVLRLTDPGLLIAIGDGAAGEIDDLPVKTSKRRFTDAKTGKPFPWKRNTTGLRTPSLHAALDDDALKRDFWRAFKAASNLPRNP